MKVAKSYRFSEFTLGDLNALKAIFPNATETEIIERAIHEMKIQYDPTFTNN